ncbi:methyltransferase domain-containing protein [Methylocystis sp.]|uniref:methyltransferase domain-containing protein n=1 Tax=Methylocystis sp. TaxID=1911079 RepID=UPI003DA2CF5C
MDGIGAEIHGGIPREGPGNTVSTRQAFLMLKDLPDDAAILDVGSGPGMQTLEIAKMCRGTVTAVDTDAGFLAELAQRASDAGLSERIHAVQASMFDMPFEDSSFDLIWSEGAIYIIGFKEGLQAWGKYLKRGGYIAVTHISWLRSQIPEEPRAFWNEAYPKGLLSIDDNLKIATEAGFREVGHFTLPESAWWDDYYTPLEQKLPPLREKYAGNPAAIGRVEQTQREIDLYRKYADCYGYVFYVLQRTA